MNYWFKFMEQAPGWTLVRPCCLLLCPRLWTGKIKKGDNFSPVSVQISEVISNFVAASNKQRMKLT